MCSARSIRKVVARMAQAATLILGFFQYASTMQPLKESFRFTKRDTGLERNLAWKALNQASFDDSRCSLVEKARPWRVSDKSGSTKSFPPVYHVVGQPIKRHSQTIAHELLRSVTRFGAE